VRKEEKEENTERGKIQKAKEGEWKQRGRIREGARKKGGRRVNSKRGEEGRDRGREERRNEVQARAAGEQTYLRTSANGKDKQKGGRSY
jgi:hypothetical protein